MMNTTRRCCDSAKNFANISAETIASGITMKPTFAQKPQSVT